MHVGLSAAMHNFCSLKPLCYQRLERSQNIPSDFVDNPVAVDAAVPRNDPLRWGFPLRGGTIQLRWGERFASGAPVAVVMPPSKRCVGAPLWKSLQSRLQTR